MLWVDAHYAASSVPSDAAAQALVERARSIGISHLCLEAVAADGARLLRNEGPAGRAYTRLRAAAISGGLSIVAVLPGLVPGNRYEVESLQHAARWDGSQWLIEPGSKLSPAGAEAYSSTLARLRELIEEPGVEAILLVDVGFETLNSGLGPGERRRFEAWVGTTFKNWPAEVLGSSPPPSAIGRTGRGPYWDLWQHWRATLVLDFMLQARAQVDAGASGTRRLLALVDAPYAAHQRQGLNWAIPASPALADNRWLPERYERTGAGHLLDGIALGFWQPDLVTAGEAEKAGFYWWSSMEGAVAAARRYRRTGSPIYAALTVDAAEAPQRAIKQAALTLDGMILIGAEKVLGDSRIGEAVLEAAGARRAQLSPPPRPQATPATPAGP
jgi:hypothetical protein